MTGTTVDRRAATGLGPAAAGMLLVAATYGMARFGVGLFAPALGAARPDLTGVLGWAGAAQFTSYSLAAVVAARWVDRRPRAGLLLAGATAILGCLGVAVASSPVLFVAAVFIGGLGGGFASPALVPVIDAVVAPHASATAQSVVNSGTAVGVIGAGVVASTALAVGPAWVCMAMVCAVATVAAWYPVRARADLAAADRPTAAPPSAPAGTSSAADRPTAAPASVPPPTLSAAPVRASATGLVRGPWRPLVLPGAAAVVAGAGSSLVWTFGPVLITDSGAVATAGVGWLWIALGLGGALGTLTGALVRRAGIRGAWCWCAGALAVAATGVAMSAAAGTAWPAYAGMALFGAGYMGLSGVLILWARQVRPGGAGAGTSALFVALATGQALGSAGFGLAQGVAGPVVLAALAAGLCALGGLTVLLRTR
ncbi:MFS transporter [Kocuria aegyptia]|uniref:MFS transporter n=1 Tax=Kocuria aegyptia TaxID=330943 RepID=A0ABN2K1I4_9MICC